MKKKGYMLLECMIAISISVLILLIAIPSIKIFKEKKQFNEVIELKNILIFSRNRAISSRKNIRFYYNEIDDTYNAYEEFTGKPILKDSKLLNNIIILNINNDIVFTSSGVPKIGATIELKTEFKYYDITIQPATGKINLKILDK